MRFGHRCGSPWYMISTDLLQVYNYYLAGRRYICRQSVAPAIQYSRYPASPSESHHDNSVLRLHLGGLRQRFVHVYSPASPFTYFAQVPSRCKTGRRYTLHAGEGKEQFLTSNSRRLILFPAYDRRGKRIPPHHYQDTPLSSAIAFTVHQRHLWATIQHFMLVADVHPNLSELTRACNTFVCPHIEWNRYGILLESNPSIEAWSSRLKMVKCVPH